MRRETVFGNVPGDLLQAHEGTHHLGKFVLHDEQVAGHGWRVHKQTSKQLEPWVKENTSTFITGQQIQ